jgi:thymidylate kinase
MQNASERSNFGEERYENNDFQNKVALRYKELKTSDWKVRLVIS